MYFHSKSGRWWTGSHRQWRGPSPPRRVSILCLAHLSFRYLSTSTGAFLLLTLFPSLFLFPLDCPGLINRMLNLETYSSKSQGPEKRKGTGDETAPVIRVYYLLFISLRNVRSSLRNLPLMSLWGSHHSFSVQLNISGHILQRTTFNWQRYYSLGALSFRSVGPHFIKLGVCWRSNTKPLPLRITAASVRLSRARVPHPSFPNSLLFLTSSDCRLALDVAGQAHNGPGALYNPNSSNTFEKMCLTSGGNMTGKSRSKKSMEDNIKEVRIMNKNKRKKLLSVLKTCELSWKVDWLL